MTRDDLRLLQSLPLEDKIRKTQLRVREWYEHHCGNVYISFSGGKDSTVLWSLVKGMYPKVPAVFCDTGLEYPEVREFVTAQKDVEIIRPKMSFYEVIQKYGYPVVAKDQAQFIYQVRTTKSEHTRDIRMNGALRPDGTRKRLGTIYKMWRYLIDAPFRISDTCCDVMKKRPMKKYEKDSGRVPMTGVMAADSRRRMTNYLMRGCNSFDGTHPMSTPMGFWTEQDVLRFLVEYDIPYSSVYGDIVEEGGVLRTTGVEQTGCMFCMFGLHHDRRPNRFEQMKETHPKLWEYCIHKLGIGRVLDYMEMPYGGDTKDPVKVNGDLEKVTPF